MSPEMLRGESHDLRLDIYCLGALMYEMLTGLPPHYSQDVNQMYQQIIDDEIDFPFYISEEACSLMRKLLMKDPKERFQTISDVKKHEYFQDIVWEDYLNK